MIETADARLQTLRAMVSEVLELDEGELQDDADFGDEYDADSLRAIEILARIEKRYRVEIPQSELPRMANLNSVYEVLAQHAGW